MDIRTNMRRAMRLLAITGLAACSSSDTSTQPSFSPEMVAAAGSYQLSVVNGAPIPQDLGAVNAAACPHVIADGGSLTLSYGPNTPARFTLNLTTHGACNGQPASGGDAGFTFTGSWSLANGALALHADGTTSTNSIQSASYSGDGVTVAVAWAFPQTKLTYTR